MVEMTLTQQANDVIATLSKDIKNNKLALPSPPDIMLNIRTLIADQNTTTDDISALIKQDPHISGRLIKVANCAIFGGRLHVTMCKFCSCSSWFIKSTKPNHWFVHCSKYDES